MLYLFGSLALSDSLFYHEAYADFEPQPAARPLPAVSVPTVPSSQPAAGATPPTKTPAADGQRRAFGGQAFGGL